MRAKNSKKFNRFLIENILNIRKNNNLDIKLNVT